VFSIGGRIESRRDHLTLQIPSDCIKFPTLTIGAPYAAGKLKACEFRFYCVSFSSGTSETFRGPKCRGWASWCCCSESVQRNFNDIYHSIWRKLHAHTCIALHCHSYYARCPRKLIRVRSIVVRVQRYASFKTLTAASCNPGFASSTIAHKATFLNA
jgi:hypothetical protein